MQPKNTSNRSTVDINSPFYLYQREIQSIPVLNKKDELTLHQAIESHLQDILWIFTEVPECLDIIHSHFEQITGGALKLDTLLYGFASLEPPKLKPDLPEVQQRLFKLLIHQYDTQGKLKNFGPESSKTQDSQRRLVECLSSFKWTALIIDKVVHYAQVLTAETGLKHKLDRSLTALKQAKQALIANNLRLVFFVAKKHAYLGAQFLDLIQEGNIGLIQAIERFDYRWGYAFSSYASIWIKHAILNAVSKFQSTPAEEDDILENLEDQKTPSHLDVVSGCDLLIFTHQALSSLPLREAKILQLRFGIGIPCPYTLAEIGEMFEISRERIRQIETKALKALGDQYQASSLKISLN